MIDSPAFDEWRAEGVQMAVVAIMGERFGRVPPAARPRLSEVYSLTSLRTLIRFAATCPDVSAFEARLSATPASERDLPPGPVRRDRRADPPVLSVLEAHVTQRALMEFLDARFGRVPESIRMSVSRFSNRESLFLLVRLAATCPGLEGFGRVAAHLPWAVSEPPFTEDSWRAEGLHQAILDLLGIRFPDLPPGLQSRLESVYDLDSLHALTCEAVSCRDLTGFQAHLIAAPTC